MIKDAVPQRTAVRFMPDNLLLARRFRASRRSIQSGGDRCHAPDRGVARLVEVDGARQRPLEPNSNVNWFLASRCFGLDKRLLLFRQCSTAYPQQATRQRLAELLQLYERVRATFDGPDAVCRWFQGPSRYLGGISPAEAVRVGRPEKADWRPGSTDYAAPRRPVGVEDSPRYSGSASVTDRRSAELDAELDAWQREQAAKAGAPHPELDEWESKLNEREADLRRRELEVRQRELDQRELEQRERDLEE